jgi:hypothetical protein
VVPWDVEVGRWNGGGGGGVLALAWSDLDTAGWVVLEQRWKEPSRS